MTEIKGKFKNTSFEEWIDKSQLDENIFFYRDKFSFLLK
jgi:hypothetical protein